MLMLRVDAATRTNTYAAPAEAARNITQGTSMMHVDLLSTVLQAGSRADMFSHTAAAVKDAAEAANLSWNHGGH